MGQFSLRLPLIAFYAAKFWVLHPQAAHNTCCVLCDRCEKFYLKLAVKQNHVRRKDPFMKLISWNVNGLRACMNKGFMNFLKESNADIFCVQETKMQPEQADFIIEGYEQYWNSAERKGYSGTAVFTKVSPLSVQYGIGIDEHDHEGRVITLEFEKFFLVNVYTPNSQRDLARLDYRMKWEDDFRDYLIELDVVKPVVVCGDMNVAHQEIDLKKMCIRDRTWAP